MSQPMQEGDVFRWSWKQPRERDAYWCCACLAVFWAGKLRDLYWTNPFSPSCLDGKAWSEPDAVRLLALEHLGNLAGFAEWSGCAIYEYDPSDLIDLRHPNGGNVWLREGAAKSLTVQIGTARRELDKARREAESAIHAVSWREQELARLEAQRGMSHEDGSMGAGGEA